MKPWEESGQEGDGEQQMVLLVSLSLPAGDYDAILVLMLLPRIVFKAELVIDQLKQQVQRMIVQICTQ